MTKNVLTFDLEEYFQVSGFEHAVDAADWGRFESRVEAQTKNILELLDEHDTRATFFVLGWTAERHPELVREIAGRGHETASHGYAHRLVYDQGPRAFRRDVRDSIRVLRDITGRIPLGYRAPSFSIVERSIWALRILAEEGFLYDSSVFPVRHDRYGIPGAKSSPYEIEPDEGLSIRELPPLTREVLGVRVAAGGGGWLRLFPLGHTRAAIRQMNEAGHPAVLYLHPWETDPEQPRLPGVKGSAMWRHFVGMEGVMEKLRRLLGEFEFTTAADALGLARPAVVAESDGERAVRSA